MSPLTEQQEQDELSSSDDNDNDDDDVLDEDLESLRRACMLTGTNPNDLITTTTNPPPFTSANYSDSDDDLELVRNIQNRFSNDTLSLKPLCTLPPAASDDEDDFETLRAIERRFANYNCDTLKQDIECGGSPNDLPVNSATDCSEEFTNSGFIENHQSEPMLPIKKSSCFPKSALLLTDAIKKNRSSQTFFRSQLIHLEARIEENKRLRERVKILKDFQTSCKKRTGRALSQRKDPRVQLISVNKSCASKDNSKVNDKRASAMSYGPAENSHVTNYRTALTNFPLSLDRKKWSKEERENLGKGIRQQFQEMVLQMSVDRSRHPFLDKCLSDSDLEGSSGDSNDYDKILVSIKDLEVTPENIREFLPKVNWEQLASMYVVGRSGAECEASICIQ